MPRPKPSEPLLRADFRLTHVHKAILKDLGGVAWIRKMLEKHAPLPMKYYKQNSKD